MTSSKALLSTIEVISASGLRGKRCLHVGDLLLDRAFGLGEDHLAICLDLGAGVVEALLHRLPERVRGRGMVREDDVERLVGAGSAGSADDSAAPSRSIAVSFLILVPPFVDVLQIVRLVGDAALDGVVLGRGPG